MDTFYFKLVREIRFDISSPTAVNFKGAKYVIYFNPIIFLSLDMKQMESTIKHEILHVLSLHLLRGKELKNKYSTLAINISNGCSSKSIFKLFTTICNNTSMV